jgi:NAD(P)-dependent dehydrogenase (short-subunit alcohol dehydrogenase family)
MQQNGLDPDKRIRPPGILPPGGLPTARGISGGRLPAPSYRLNSYTPEALYLVSGCFGFDFSPWRVRNCLMNGKRVVIVGGSSGIGLALAKQVRELGAELFLGARKRGPLEEVALQLGARWAVVDTMEESSVRKFFAEAGEIDHLATPGSSVRAWTLASTSHEDYLYTLRNKAAGQALCAKHARVQPKGSITFFSGSLAARPAEAPMLGSVNAAVEALGRGLAAELRPVRVNVVSPGLTRNTLAFAGMSADDQERMFAESAARLPVGRAGEPGDSAAAAVFLMQNEFVTGQVLYIDGGVTAL